MDTECYGGINPGTEQIIRLADFGKVIGSKYPYRTVMSWVKTGRKNRWSGRYIQLESIQMPTGLSTSVEAYWRFIRRLNALE